LGPPEIGPYFRAVRVVSASVGPGVVRIRNGTLRTMPSTIDENV
jgi:hypothetical protein